MNGPLSFKEIKSIINYFLKQKASDPVVFTGKFYQIFKEEIISILYNPFQRTEAEGILPNSMRSTLPQYQSQEKKITSKGKYDQYLL